MRIDTALGAGLGDAREAAARLEAAGSDGLWVSETRHDPFLQVLLALDGTDRARVGTNIAVAFARSPMTVAVTANDLQAHGGGRFVLGLGSQVKPSIEKRFSMPWSRPAARMREYVLALRAIWACWYEGERLNFRGEFYRHTLMTPFFTPPNHGHGAPPVLVAGVGPLMTEVAGEVADGFLVHPFTTTRYLREVTLAHLEQGRARSGRPAAGFELVAFPLLALGDGETRETAVAKVKERIAFYGSTPAYRPVLAMHGWEDLGVELNALTRQGRWDEMGALIDEDVVDAFAFVGDEREVARKLVEDLGGVATRLVVAPEHPAGPEAIAGLVAAVREATST